MSAAPINLVLSFEDARRVVEEQAALVQACGTECVDLLASAISAIHTRWLCGSICGFVSSPGNARSDRRNQSG
jgi:hypothetical protein